ncbi:MAG: hypothetical protein ACXVBE_13700, partial [Bdellovibrionota bacterium]
MYAHTLKILVLALALVAQAAFAKDPELPPALPGFKMGMEVELLPEKLANLTVLFDFEKLEENTAKFEKGISQLLERTANRYKKFYASEGDISKNYLRNAPSAFRQLPPELQAKLSEGLNLKSKVLADAPQLLGAEGKPLEKKAGFILPGAAKISGLQAAPQKLILPDAAALPAKTAPPVDASLFQSSGSLEVPNRLEWEKLYKRWEELPVETRNSVVKLDLLGPKEKAIVMFEAATWGNEMPLKESLSKEDKDLFSRLKWEGDGDALEFKHKKPVESPEQFVADLRRFAKRAQIEQHIFHPEQPRSDSFHKNAAGEIVEEAKQWGSFHYHYSLEGKDLTLFAEEMNINIFMTRLEQGIYNDLENQRFGFKNIHGKGLMRLVTYDHMEIRAHSEALLNELAKQFGPLFTLNTEAAAQA